MTTLPAVTEVRSIHVDTIRQETAPWLEKAHQLQITDLSMVQLAGEYLQQIKALRNLIAEKIDPVIKANHAAHKAAVALKKDLESELVESDQLIAKKVSDWQNEQARQKRLLEAAAEVEARAEREKAEAEARALQAMGEKDLAEMAAAEAKLLASRPAFVAPTVKVDGIGTREVYKARVTDKLALVKAVAEGRVPLAALEVNEKLLGQQARSLKEALDWPGVEVWAEMTVVRR